MSVAFIGIAFDVWDAVVVVDGIDGVGFDVWGGPIDWVFVGDGFNVDWPGPSS